MNEMDGSVCLWGGGGGKENMQVCQGVSFDLQDIGLILIERISQEHP